MPRSPRLLDLDDGRHLANTSDRGVRRLVYSTWACYPDMVREGEIVVTARPHFELTDLPARSHVFIEEHDPYEDGIVFFRLEERSGTMARRKGRPCSGRSGGPSRRPSDAAPGSTPHLSPPSLTRVRREKRKLRTDPGGFLQESDWGVPGEHPTLVPFKSSRDEPEAGTVSPTAAVHPGEPAR